MLGISVPVFVTAPLLILVFAMRLHWLPAGDWVAGSWRHLLLPSVALALPYCAYIARIVRAAAIEALSQPYIRTARAKGLPPHLILWRHASRATLMPLVSFLGPALAGLLTGSIVVEQVFGLPGIGRLFVTGALNRDYTVVTGITVLYGALIIGFNLLVDLCYAWLDPRIRSRSMNAQISEGGLWSESWRRLRARPSTRYAALLLALIVAAAVVVPVAVAIRLFDAGVDANLRRALAPRRPAIRHRRSGTRPAGARHVGMPDFAAGRQSRPA